MKKTIKLLLEFLLFVFFISVMGSLLYFDVAYGEYKPVNKVSTLIDGAIISPKIVTGFSKMINGSDEIDFLVGKIKYDDISKNYGEITYNFYYFGFGLCAIDEKDFGIFKLRFLKNMEINYISNYDDSFIVFGYALRGF